MSDEMVSTQGTWIGRLLPWIAALAVGLGFWLGFQMMRPPGVENIQLQAGTALPQRRPLAPFELVDDSGKAFTLADLEGRWSFLAFGYTLCPDICPTTLATLNAIDQELKNRSARAAREFVFVSIDPERDNPQRLKEFLAFFNPQFRGVTAPEKRLRPFTQQLGIPYARVEGQATALGYLMDHSGAILLVDPKAQLAAIFSPPHEPRKMAADFLALSDR